MMEPARQLFWNIGSRSFLTVWMVLVVCSFITAVALRILCPRPGEPSARPHRSVGRLLWMVLTFQGIHIGHLPLRMHRCILYGFCLLVLATVLVGVEDHFGVPLLRGHFFLGFELVGNVAGVALLVGLGMAAYIRYVKRATRFENRLGDAFLLGGLALVVVSGFALQGARLLATQDSWKAWSPVGWLIAFAGKPFCDTAEARWVHAVIWHGHAALAMCFLTLAPWTKLTHVLALPLNLRSARPVGEKNHLEASGCRRPEGTATLADVPVAGRFEVDACMACGRCRKLCPIALGGIPLTPETLLRGEKRFLVTGRWKQPLLGSVITEEALWSCTACRSCEERCPMGGEIVERFVAIRRHAVQSGQLPDAVAAHLDRMSQPRSQGVGRFAQNDTADVIYIWPGCQARSGKGEGVLLALVRLTQHAGLKPVVLGPPYCCAGSARLLGDEARFVKARQANMAYLEPLAGERIVTPCPHCYTTLRYEYPVACKLQHHSLFLLELQERSLLLAGMGEGGTDKVTYHDPCFLGRYHGAYDAPRKLLQGMPALELVEMSQSRNKGFCCGSGGGTALTKSTGSNARKRVRQAQATTASLLVTGCPYCREHLGADGNIAVEDIAEILARVCQV